MAQAATAETPEPIGFFLVPKFSMIAFTSAIEPLRSANRMSERNLYSWRLFSKDGGPVAASSGIALMPDAAISATERLPTIIVCGGNDIHLYRDKEVFSWLRRLARTGVRLGALCTGSHILAAAGLLDGHRCTLHWENIPGFIEAFPDIEVTTELFETDRTRFTCSGGTAPLDMMLHMIAVRHGAELAATVSDQFIHDRIRGAGDNQRMTMPARLGVRNGKLIAAITRMEDNIEEPLSRRDIAAGVGLSTRQLERLFRAHLGTTPRRHYLEVRLRRARQLLFHSGLSVLDVALACGFVSASHFAKCYREHFGTTPREERSLAA